MKNPFEQYPVIKFEDIRNGDTIANVEQRSNFQKVNVGTVALRDNHGSAETYLYTDGGMYQIAVSYENEHTFYLIDRPKPEMPTKQGAPIYIKKYDGRTLDTPALAIHDGSDGAHHWFIPGGVDVPVLAAWWVKESLIEDFTLAEVKEVTA